MEPRKFNVSLNIELSGSGKVDEINLRSVFAVLEKAKQAGDISPMITKNDMRVNFMIIEHTLPQRPYEEAYLRTFDDIFEDICQRLESMGVPYKSYHSEVIQAPKKREWPEPDPAEKTPGGVNNFYPPQHVLSALRPESLTGLKSVNLGYADTKRMIYAARPVDEAANSATSLKQEISTFDDALKELGRKIYERSKELGFSNVDNFLDWVDEWIRQSTGK